MVTFRENHGVPCNLDDPEWKPEDARIHNHDLPEPPWGPQNQGRGMGMTNVERQPVRSSQCREPASLKND